MTALLDNRHRGLARQSGRVSDDVFVDYHVAHDKHARSARRPEDFTAALRGYRQRRTPYTCKLFNYLTTSTQLRRDAQLFPLDL